MIHFRSQSLSTSGWKWVNEGASPNAIQTSLIVTDENQISEMAVKTYHNGIKKKKKKNKSFVEYGKTDKHRFNGKTCFKNQGIRHIIPALEGFPPSFPGRKKSTIT